MVFELTEEEPVVMEYMLFMRHTDFLPNYLPICHSEPFKTVRNILQEGMRRGEVKQQDVFVAGISFTGVILRAAELRLVGVYQNSLRDNFDCFMANAWNTVKTYDHQEEE